MSDLFGNPEDRFSRVAAQMTSWLAVDVIIIRNWFHLSFDVLKRMSLKI